MSFQFVISNVSAEFMMDVAKALASSPHSLTKEDLYKSFQEVSKTYVSRAISQCLQLGLISTEDEKYTSSDKYRDLIKRSERSQLFIPFRKILQRYPPFLLYIDFISKGYSSRQSANMTRGIFRIKSSEKIVEGSFNRWGRYAQLIEIDESGILSIPEAEEGLPSEYVKNLLKALRADLQARIFIIETMSQQAYTYLTSKNIGLDNLSDALIEYETNPKASVNKATQTFEHFLHELGTDLGANVISCNGIMQLADAIRGRNGILNNQLHLCHGVGALRNMSHHDPDKETGLPWNFTPHGAIISVLIVPTMIRSLHLYRLNNKQEL